MRIRPGIEDRTQETEDASEHGSSLMLAVIVPFLNEAEHLPSTLSSIAAQTRPPECLLLVDDGSTDGSSETAQAFAAAHVYARYERRPPRPPKRDRLATAAELVAFQWALEQLDGPFDVVAKLDADLELNPSHFEQIMTSFEGDPDLGLAGAYLSIRGPGGGLTREQHAADHVRGATKFYRRACMVDMGTLPTHLGWDAVDEVKARMHGWRTMSIELSGGDSIHLRPTGVYDGRLRAFSRWGECAYGYGSHPLNVLAGSIARTARRPYLVAGLAYAYGWVMAAVRGRPRAEPDVRRFKRSEELERLRATAASLPRTAFARLLGDRIDRADTSGAGAR